MSQYDIRFTQLSRCAVGLVREEEDRTKSFVWGLRHEIRSKLVPFQLQNYVQAVEKALDVERDILKDQEVPNKEFPPSKHFWYQETHGSEGSNLKFNRSTGSSAVPASRYHSRTGNRGGFLHRPQSISSPHLNMIRNPWSPDATETMWATAFRAGNVSHVAILAT